MKKFLIALIVIVALASLTISAAEVSRPSQRIGVSYTMAQSADKPMLVYFYVDWCTYCQRFMPKLKLIDAIYKNAYSIVMVNCEDPMNKKIIETYHIEAYPTLYIYDRKANIKFPIQYDKYDDIEALRKELDRYISIQDKQK